MIFKSVKQFDRSRIAASVTDFFEGTLSALNRARFRFHIWWCGDCRVHVDKMEQLVEALGTIPPPEKLPEELERLARGESADE